MYAAPQRQNLETCSAGSNLGQDMKLQTAQVLGHLGGIAAVE